MLSMEDELIKVFCEVDDKLNEMGYQDHHLSQFTAPEVITIGIMKELWRLRTIKSVWRLIHDQFGSFFPSTVFLQPLDQAF
jgi:hypothetical protein